MKKLINILCCIALVILWTQVVFADSISLAKQWEARGKFAQAASEWSMAASQTDNLNDKAKYMAEVGRCRLKAGEVAYLGAIIADIKTYASDRGAKLVPKLLAQAEELAWRLGDQDARQIFSVIVQENPSRRKDLSEKANAKNRKFIAYWLDPGLNKADCRAKRTKALQAKTTAEVTAQLSASRDICQDIPSEVEHNAFSARADAETDFQSALALYEQIKTVWKYLNQSSIDSVLTNAEKLTHLRGREKDVERARAILPSEVVERSLPRFMPYGFGDHEMSLTANTRTPHLIASSVVGGMGFRADKGKFMLIYENGTEYRMWLKEEIERLNSQGGSGKFFLHCIETSRDCGITMYFK